MSRVQRILIASALLLISVFALVVIVSQIGMNCYGGPDDTGVATLRVVVFEPAVIGTVVAALAVIALLAHLLIAVRRAAPRWMWIAAGLAPIIAVVTAVVVSMADRPTC